MMDTGTLSTAMHLDVSPPQSLVDEPISVRLSGLEPGQKVVVRAQTKDGNLLPWASFATFCADAQGEIDVSVQKPVEGSYDESDPMGLFWSMAPQSNPLQWYFTKSKATPLNVTISAEIDGQSVASATIKRLFAAPGVQRISVEELGLVGTLFLPAAPGPHPCVILLNGSDGGYREHSAALLASRGYAAFALAYFGVENCPEHLVTIPLEYFETALNWLKAQEAIDKERLAVIGLSRGGELALLLGATFPAIKAVIACAPSGLVHSGLKNFRSVSASAWSFHGKQVPYISAKISAPERTASTLSFFWKIVRRKRLRLLDGFQQTLEHASPEVTEQATIPVEKTNGPILLISGKDDQLWPSSHFSEMVIAHLKAHNFAYSYSHLCYEGAGHFVCFPYALPSLPASISRSRPGITFYFGGTPKAHAQAASASWPRILQFLEESFRTPQIQ